MEYPGQTASGQCYRCGYDLRGIADDQPCPECGLLAERSRRVTDELHNTRPKWLRTIARGSNLILLAIVTAVLWMLFVKNDFRFIVSYMSMRHPDFGLWGLDFALIIFLLGVALLTRREGYAPADLADRWLRRLLRIVPLFLVAAAVTEWIYFAIIWPRRYFLDNSTLLLLLLLLFAGSFPLPFLVFLPCAAWPFAPQRPSGGTLPDRRHWSFARHSVRVRHRFRQSLFAATGVRSFLVGQIQSRPGVDACNGHRWNPLPPLVPLPSGSLHDLFQPSRPPTAS